MGVEYREICYSGGVPETIEFTSIIARLLTSRPSDDLGRFIRPKTLEGAWERGGGDTKMTDGGGVVWRLGTYMGSSSETST